MPEGRREVDVAGAMARATAALVTVDDTAGLLVGLLDECCAVMSAEAAGVLALIPDGSVEVLSASSHKANELEMYQSQTHSGPCLDTINFNSAVSAPSAEQAQQRWPLFAEAMVTAGFGSAHSYPLRWHDMLIGGLNIFRSTEGALTEEQDRLGQTFADFAAIAIVCSGHVDMPQVVAQTRRALRAREIIEQAKGYLAFERDLDMAAAYDYLKKAAAESGRTLSDEAQHTLGRQTRPT